MSKSLFLMCLLLIVTVDILAADEKENACVKEPSNKGSCPLKTLRSLKENPPEAIEIRMPDGIHKLSSQSQSAQSEGTIRSILGDEKTAQLVFDWDTAESGAIPVMPSNIQTFDAISKIIELAQDTKVVMINEAHHVSMHRVFALELAKALKKVGFTHIAAETFGHVGGLTDRGYPTLDDGAYIGDSEFGHFIRTAALLGYGFVNYESSKFDRELGQAENLASFVDRNPNAKMLVYAGYGHIRETTIDENNTRMGEYFQELTQIDPLTLDQDEGTSHYKKALNDPHYAMVEPLIDGTSKVFSIDGEWLSSKHYEGSVDVTVFHPPETLIDGRASWLSTDNNRQSFAVAVNDIPKERPVVIKAVIQNEWEQSGALAIPVDQILVKEKDVPSLFLPKGDYILKVETWSGKQTVFRENIIIE